MENILKEFEVLQKNLNDLPIENLSDYDLSKTALFIVDINNGFAKEGALYSDRIKSLINPIHEFVKPLENKLNKIIAFTDTHEEDSVELLSYVPHCLSGSDECKVVDELLDIKNLEIIPKNSDFYNKFATKLEYDSFIISYLKNDVNDIKIIIDKENVTLISSKSINLVDSQLNEFLLDYKNMIGKKMKVSICENCKEYDY